MQPHQQRVVEELKELTEKLGRLSGFLAGGVFVGLPADEQRRLRRQLHIMQMYEDVLQERIEHFPKD